MKKALIVIALLATLAMTIPLALADPAHCKVTGGGWIIPNSGPLKATFGFNAMQYGAGQTPSPPIVKGELEYIDRNTEMNVHGDVDEWVNIFPDAYLPNQEAEFEGSAKVNGVSGFSFWCHVIDNGEPGESDWFRVIVWNNAGFYYDSGLKELGGGNIQTHPLPPPMNPEV